jgi:Tol biopolymer transport system component
MRANGRGKRRVIASGVSESNASFFPRGRSIVYQRFRGRGFDVMTARLNGTRVKLAAADAGDPAISPDGELLAFSKQFDRVGGIRLRDLDSGRTRRLTTGSAQELDFSPNGKRIVFTGQRPCSRPGGELRFGLLSVDLSSGDVDRLRVECRREWIGPSWAPNGKRIIAVRKKLARTGPALRFRLAVLTPGGRLIDGEPRHRRGTNEMFPAWQPLRR